MTLSIIEKVFLLQGAELFREVPVQELVAIAQLCQEISFKKDEVFIREGDDGDCLYIISSGEASVYLEGDKDKQVSVRRQGDAIGEMAIVTNNPRTASCVALADITALRITFSDFSGLMEENSAVTLGVLKVVTANLESITGKIKSQPGETEQRVTLFKPRNIDI